MSNVTRITEYLSSGGLWNPELANHENVRDLLIECREELSSANEVIKDLVEALENILLEDDHADFCRFKTEQICSCMDRRFFNLNNLRINAREVLSKIGEME